MSRERDPSKLGVVLAIAASQATCCPDISPPERTEWTLRWSDRVDIVDGMLTQTPDEVVVESELEGGRRFRATYRVTGGTHER